MNLAKKISLASVATLVASLLNSTAQPAVVMVTNYVTVTITNVVTITNFVTSAPTSPAVTVIAAGVPPAPKIAPTNSWQSSASAGLTLTRGNSDTMMFTADFLTQRKTVFDEYKIGLDAAYGEQNSDETVNNYKAFGQWNHLFTQRFFSYARGEGLRDIIADLDYRVTVGPGAGYYLIKGTNTTLAVEAGGAYDLQRLGEEEQTFITLRLAERFEHKINDHARLWQSAEIMPQVDKLDNYVVNFEIGAEAAITKSFSLKTYLDDAYANRPASGKLKNDAKLVAAVGYKF